MAYQSFFSSPATSRSSGDGYQSFFGLPVRQAPSAGDLATQRQQQAQQDTQNKAAKQKQDDLAKQQAQQNSLLGKVKSVGKGIIDSAKTTGEKALNTLTAGGADVIGLGTAGVQAATGNKQGAKVTLAATQQTSNDFLDKGVGGKGGYLTSKQAMSSGGGAKGYVNNFIKPVSQGASDIAPYVVPVGKAAQGASLTAKVVRGAAENAALNTATTVGNAEVQGTLNKNTGKDIAKNVLAGSLIGGAAPFLHGALKEGASQVSTKGAAEALNNAKVNSLLDTGKKANTRDTAATIGNATVKGATAESPSASLLGKVSFKGANTEKIPVKDTSTSVPGKVSTIDGATYAKESAKLSKAYDSESTAIKSAPPIKQQVLQSSIDAKYTDLQQKLDESAGKTKVDFSGPQKNVETPAPIVSAEVPKVNSIPAEVLAKSEATRAAATPPVEAPVISEKPIETNATPTGKPAVVLPDENVPQRATSKVAASIQEKAVARGLKNDFGEAGGYDRVTIADQAAKAVKVANDRPLLDSIINGEKPLPDGLRATALIKAVEEHPVLGKDHELINRLSQAEHLTGESSRSAQELRLAAERSPHSPTEAIRTVRKAREAALESKTGKTVAEVQSGELKAIRAAKATVPKPTKETFSSFVESLRC